MRIPIGTVSLLDDVTVASHCPADWNGMTGDNRARFCVACQRHVYNLSAMTAEQALALIREKEGDLCVRLYRRRDGTVLTADCPVGLRQLAFRPDLARGYSEVTVEVALAPRPRFLWRRHRSALPLTATKIKGFKSCTWISY